MPGGDRTGPMGRGPMTGRAAGNCAGYPTPGFANPIPGFGRGRGKRFYPYANADQAYPNAYQGYGYAYPGSGYYGQPYAPYGSRRGFGRGRGGGRWFRGWRW